MIKHDIASESKLEKYTSISVNYIGPKWAVPSFFAVTDQPGITQEHVEEKYGFFDKWSTSSDSTSTAFATDQQFNGKAYKVTNYSLSKNVYKKHYGKNICF